MFTRRPSTFISLLTGRALVNKLNNLNVNYLKILKKHREPLMARDPCSRRSFISAKNRLATNSIRQ